MVGCQWGGVLKLPSGFSHTADAVSWFLSQRGGVAQGGLSRHAYLEPQEADLIPLFMRMNYDTMRFFAMNRLERGRYLEVLDEYYRLHVPEFPELKSLDVLKEVFA